MKNELEIFLEQFDKLTLDSTQISKNTVFIAYPGKKFDGRDFIEQAINNGAKGVVFESKNFKKNLNLSIPSIAINGLKSKLPSIADKFYAYPSKKVSITGITGTNGKTTSAYWLSQCLNYLGSKTAFIGTLGYGDAKSFKKIRNTTPSALDIQYVIKDISEKKYKNIAMEVSSHGINEKRINNINFNERLFTNLTRDHMDYHKTMKAYADVKRKFMCDGKDGSIIVNIDDKVGESIFKKSTLASDKKISFSIHKKSKIQATNISQNKKNLKFNLNYYGESFPITLEFGGEFNVYNILGVVGCLSSKGFEINQIIDSLNCVTGVPGRSEYIKSRECLPSVMIDYAHTDDALENILKSVKNNAFKKILLVFGAGGDRDRGKRKAMAKIAEMLSDRCIITTDNPRNENPIDIIKDISKHFNRKPIEIIDRKEAIGKAIDIANKDDLVIVAGKGDEEFQEIGNKKNYFSDRKVIEQFLKERELKN
ncbi:UDP-N-acetylmuramoyl-L-alanyl-D-glutamate--2,6-diaminopimelate ligase [Methylophilaceae bacterium Uisw_097]|jgi:UDP-N-acetylmuramoyl-L-alanyl-D-glutamate--2,6-diaminopimelate ligase|tara:strand:- start:988 stop:2430 length:1443 start_codon:yes stop_codon:yes gene_type:complete